MRLLVFIFPLLLSSCVSQHNDILYKTKPAFYSYIIGNAVTSQIDKEHYSEVYTTPASCQKTIISLLALKILGPNYIYLTRLLATKGNKNIVISFAGDPTLTSSDLEELLAPLQNTHIVGKIFLDASLFKVPPYSPNIMIDDMGKRFAPPISSINIDKNTIKLLLSPSKLGQLATIESDTNFPIKSEVTTTNQPSAIKLLSWEGTKIKVTGTINSQDEPTPMAIATKDIDLFIMKKLATILKKLNIKGQVAIIHDKNQLPQKLELLASHASLPLKKILITEQKKSDNLTFDSLYLILAAGISNWNDGDKKIKELLKQYFAIDLGKSLIVDGSGLSRYNRIQPKQLLTILRAGYNDPNFIAALASPGEVNSSLETRLNLPTNIKAKTGSMSGILCLCGFNLHPSKPKAFVAMANSFEPPLSEMAYIIDNFITKTLTNR